jgi:hypothetical protein
MLKAEIEYRLSIGCRLVSVREMERQFRALGYTLDRSLDCRSIARYLDSGRCYPACTTGVSEIDTGKSAFHVEARRDSNFRAMQQLRLDIFAVSRGHILEA